MRVAAVLLMPCLMWAADVAPSWVRDAAAQPTPKYGRRVNALVLHSESNIRVDDSGKILTQTRKAVRILGREGRDEAVARVVYISGSDKVRDLKAWILRPSGEVQKLGKDRVADVAIVDNDVYNEVRARLMIGGVDADTGAVFAWEAETESKPLFLQFEWIFQNDVPALLSRFSLTIPPGWSAEPFLWNHESFKPAVSGLTQTWELRDLPPIEYEANMPSYVAIVPRLGVSVHPPQAVKSAGRAFASWAEVGTYMAELANPQMTASSAIQEKAESLTRNAKTEFEKIDAIGRYAQSVKYVSIQTGLGRGGGYQPHSATDVFVKNYGDCKDKANLMRTMLRVVGIESYPVSIFSGNPAYVREQWPTPQQFNHAIVAVKVGPETKADSVLDHPQLGRLLFFDPTDEYTSVGSLPSHEESSLALVATAKGGALVRVPSSNPVHNLLERRSEYTVDAEGNLAGTVEEVGFGQKAAEFRREKRDLQPAEFRRRMDAWVSRSSTSATLDKLDTADEGGRFRISGQVSAPGYGKIMQGRLLVFRLQALRRRIAIDAREPKRRHPLEVPAESFRETARFKLPAGFGIDELPAPIKLQSEFGSFEAKVAQTEGAVEYTSTLTMPQMVVEPAKYPEFRKFLEAAYGYGNAPVVLVKR